MQPALYIASMKSPIAVHEMKCISSMLRLILEADPSFASLFRIVGLSAYFPSLDGSSVLVFRTAKGRQRVLRRADTMLECSITRLSMEDLDPMTIHSFPVLASRWRAKLASGSAMVRAYPPYPSYLRAWLTEVLQCFHLPIPQEVTVSESMDLR